MLLYVDDNVVFMIQVMVDIFGNKPRSRFLPKLNHVLPVPVFNHKKKNVMTSEFIQADKTLYN